jgi:hypothetical protein
MLARWLYIIDNATDHDLLTAWLDYTGKDPRLGCFPADIAVYERFRPTTILNFAALGLLMEHVSGRGHVLLDCIQYGPPVKASGKRVPKGQ